MTNSAMASRGKVEGQKLDTVTSFKYLGAVVSDDGLKPDILSRLAQATKALTKLNWPIWRDNNIALGSKPPSCESWLLTANLEKRMKCFSIISYFFGRSVRENLILQKKKKKKKRNFQFYFCASKRHCF